MSFFINNANGVQYNVDPRKIEMATTQFEAMNITFNGMLDTCYNKCIEREQYNEGDVSKGEGNCIKRCVSKYVYTNKYIGGYLQGKYYYTFTPKSILKHYDLYLKSISETNK